MSKILKEKQEMQSFISIMKEFNTDKQQSNALLTSQVQQVKLAIM